MESRRTTTNQEARIDSLAIDRTWDRRVRLVGRGVVLGALALLVPIVVGVPALLVVTIPAVGAAVWNRARSDRRRDVVTDTLAFVVWALGFVIDSLPSDEMHDRYWFLFIAPSMIGSIVGVVAVPMLVWSLLPRSEICRHRRQSIVVQPDAKRSDCIEAVRLGDIE